MRKLFFFAFTLLFLLFSGTAQVSIDLNHENNEMSEFELKKKYLETLLKNKSFIFIATDMFPRGEAGINLNYDCDVQLNDSMMVSYLPFIGRSYNLAPGQLNSGFDFTREIKNYEFKKKRKGYQVKVDVNNGPDYLKYNFHITESGYSTLTVASNQRQSISFYGIINAYK
jgi:hypothetical protein